jgi:hypothetical protein
MVRGMSVRGMASKKSGFDYEDDDEDEKKTHRPPAQEMRSK